jgi:hypothetical protein
MGIEVGGCALRDLAVRPGNPDTKPSVRAKLSVLRTGEKSEACEKATSSALVLVPKVAWATCVGVGVAGKLELTSTYHKPSRWLRGPVNTIVSLSVISILCLSKITL